MRTIGFALLVILVAAIGAPSVARERVSCTARHGCMFGKDARKPIAGWNCHSRHSHARTYYFCTPGT